MINCHNILVISIDAAIELTPTLLLFIIKKNNKNIASDDIPEVIAVILPNLLHVHTWVIGIVATALTMFKLIFLEFLENIMCINSWKVVDTIETRIAIRRNFKGFVNKTFTALPKGDPLITNKNMLIVNATIPLTSIRKEELLNKIFLGSTNSGL